MNLSEFIACLIESLIVVRLCNRFLTFKIETLWWLKSLLFFVALSTHSVFFTIMNEYKYISIAFLLFIIFIYCFVFLKGELPEKLFVTFIPALTSMPISMICIHAFSVKGEKDPTNYIVLFVSKLGFFVLCEIIIRLKKKSFFLTPFQWGLQISCYIITFLVSSILWKVSAENSEANNSYLCIFILLALLDVFLYIILIMMQKGVDDKEEKNALQMELDNRIMLVSETEKRYNEIKVLRHDMKHYISTAATLIAENQSLKAKEYLEEVLEDKLLPTKGAVFTGSSIIDAILSEKQTQCIKKNIEFKVQIDTEFGDVTELDLGVIIANLIDNAVKGCEKSETPSITVSIKRVKAYLKIDVNNSLESSVLNKNPDLNTTQPDHNNHGFGIRSVRDIAAKYDGKVMFNEDNKTFLAVVILKADCQS